MQHSPSTHVLLLRMNDSLLAALPFATSSHTTKQQSLHTPACNAAGKRYGLTATQNLSVGSLLLVVPPLVTAYGDSGAAPANEELLTQLDGQQLPPWQLQWLRLLYRDPTSPAAAAAAAVAQDNQVAPDGSSVSSTSDQGQESNSQLQQQQDIVLLQQLLQQRDAFSDTAPGLNTPAAAADTATAAAAAAFDASIASIACPFNAEQLQQMILENAYSEPSEDSGASLLRELTPESVTGLWPEFALLNHSCAPNTVAVVIGQYLLLRAVAPVLAGEELSCSYLGQRGLAPVALRRAYLQGVYGFHCQVS
jgi:SET and MYND domain-containing protein